MAASTTPTEPRVDRALVFAILPALVVFAILGLPMLAGQIYTEGDLGDAYMPLKSFYARQLKAGQAFDWCPDLYCGCYLQGEGQVSMYHPLVHLAYRWLPFAAAYDLDVLLRYPLMLAGMFLLLRRWQLPAGPAMFGAVTFTFSGFNLLHFAHLPAVSIVAHIPWMLLCIDTIAETANRRRAAIAWLALALLTASQLLLGYPQYVFFSVLTEAAYVGFLYSTRNPPAARIAWIVAAKLLALLTGSVQLLPTYVALQSSFRGEATVDFLNSYSLHPANLIQLVSPYFFAARSYGEGNLYEFGLFDGAVATVLAVRAVARYRHLGAWRPITLAAIVFGSLALVLAMGSYGYLYRLQVMIPVISVFRCPSRYILLVHFAMAVLAAVALADLLRPTIPTELSRSWWRREPALAFTALAAVFACCLGLAWRALPGSQISGLIGPANKLTLGAWLVVSAVFLVVAIARGKRWAWAALAVLSVADQTAYGLWSVNTFPPETLAAYRAHAPHPPTDTYRASLRWNNSLILFGHSNTSGYLALFPNKVLNYERPDSLRLAGVEWHFTTEPIQKNVAAVGPWVRLRNPLPYVRLVAETLQTTDPAQAIRGLDLAKTATVEEAIRLPPGPVGSARLITRQAGALAIETQAEAERLLVVAESFHTGWQAITDGRPTRIVRVYGDFLGVVVPAGRHRVLLAFRPASLRQGQQLSCIGLGLILACFGFLWIKAPRRSP